MTCGTQVVGEEEHLLIIKIERKSRRKKTEELMIENVLLSPSGDLGIGLV